MKKNILLMFVAVLVCSLVGACGLLDSTVRPVSGDAQGIIKASLDQLSTESSNWQTVLTDLEANLKKDGHDLIANDIRGVMTDGISLAGVEVQCKVDFIRDRVKENLENLLARLQNRAPRPAMPGLCQAPKELDMANNGRTTLLYTGYNMDAEGIQVTLRHNAGEIALIPWTNHNSRYVMTVDVSLGSGAPLCNLNDRKIIVKWNNNLLSEIPVIKRVCESARPAPAPFPERTYGALAGYVYTASGGPTYGISEDKLFGGRCDPNYKRSHVVLNTDAMSRSAVGGSARCELVGWASNDENDCTAKVHFGGNWGTSVTCRAIIKEVGIQLPQEPAPPCPCW